MKSQSWMFKKRFRYFGKSQILLLVNLCDKFLGRGYEMLYALYDIPVKFQHLLRCLQMYIKMYPLIANESFSKC